MGTNFNFVYIRPSSEVDSPQWDLGISYNFQPKNKFKYDIYIKFKIKLEYFKSIYWLI